MIKRKNRKIVVRSDGIWGILFFAVIVLLLLFIASLFLKADHSISGYAIYNFPVSGLNLSFADVTGSAPYNSLVLYYPFDFNDPTDAVAIDYSATPKNAPYYGASIVGNGVYLNSSSFDGVSDYIHVVPLDGDRFDMTQDFSVTTWVKIIGSTGVIVSKTEPLYWSGYNQIFFIGDNKLEFQSWGAGIVNSVGDVNSGTWTHVAMTYKRDTKNISFYINGQLDSSGELITYSSTSPTSIFRIGRYGPDIWKLNGQLDEFMLFNSTLTNNQISEIYNAQSNRFAPASSEIYTIDVAPGVNRVNVSINKIMPAGTKVNISLTYLDGSWISSGTQVIGSVNSFNITSGTSKVRLNITLYPDSNKFFAPNIFGNIQLNTWYKEIIGPAISYGTGTEDNNSFINRNYLIVNSSFSDDSSSSITISTWLFNPSNLINTSILSYNGFNGSFYVNFSNLSDGVYKFNSSMSNGSVFRDAPVRVVTVDRVIPNVTLYSPENATTYYLNSYFVNISLSEPGHCEFSTTNGSTNITLDSSDSNKIFVKNKTNVRRGNYSLVAYCRDLAGNINHGSRVNFIINGTESEDSLILENLTSGIQSTIDEYLLSFGFYKILEVNDSIKFPLNGERYIFLDTFDIGSGIASLSTRNPVTTFSLGLGSNRNIDFDSDGKFDINIKFESIKDNKPEFYIKKVEQQTSLSASTGNRSSTNRTSTSGQVTDEENAFLIWLKENWWIVLVSIVLVVLIVWLLWVLIRYLNGMQVRDYHRSGPLDKIIDKQLKELMNDIKK
jgi:hypothetical protein